MRSFPLHCFATVIPVIQARNAKVLLVSLFPISRIPLVLMSNFLQNFFPGTLFFRKLVTAQNMRGKKMMPRMNSTVPVKRPGWSIVGSNNILNVWWLSGWCRHCRTRVKRSCLMSDPVPAVVVVQHSSLDTAEYWDHCGKLFRLAFHSNRILSSLSQVEEWKSQSGNSWSAASLEMYFLFCW